MSRGLRRRRTTVWRDRRRADCAADHRGQPSDTTSNASDQTIGFGRTVSHRHERYARGRFTRARNDGLGAHATGRSPSVLDGGKTATRVGVPGSDAICQCSLAEMPYDPCCPKCLNDLLRDMRTNMGWRAKGGVAPSCRLGSISAAGSLVGAVFPVVSPHGEVGMDRRRTDQFTGRLARIAD